MGDCVNFDYYYGLEPEQFKFYQIPKALIEDAKFQQLSDRAKILYSILRDRMSLSRSNGWIDKENRVYINFSVVDIMSALNCSRASALKAMQELDVKTGIGLIENKRVGQGNPNVIYVKNFNKVLSDLSNNEDDASDKKGEMEQGVEEKCLANTDEYSEVYNLDFKKSNNYTSRSLENIPQEVQKLDPNNTNYNNTELIIPPPPRENNEAVVVEDNTERYRQIVRKNIDLDALLLTVNPDKRDLVMELYNIICDMVTIPREKVKINGADYPYQVVKSQFLKLEYRHIEYVIFAMDENRTKIGNMRSYLTAVLYNSIDVVGSYWTQKVKADNVV